MPDLITRPRIIPGLGAPARRAAEDADAQQREREALITERQRAGERAEADAAREKSKDVRERALSTMGADALQWTGRKNYGVDWVNAAPEAKQHFVSAYPEVAEKAPEVWNRTLTQNTGIIPGLKPNESATVNPAGDVTRHIDAPPREQPHYFDPSKPVARFDPATGKAQTVSAGATATEPTPDEDALVERIASYDAPPPFQRGGYTQAQKTRLMDLLTQRHPDYDAKEYQARQAALTGFKSGVQARNITSANTVVGHLGSLAEAAKQLNNGSIPLWNTVANATQAGTGNPNKARFDTARDAVVTELAALFKGTGAAPSAEEIKHWRERLDSSQSPAQHKEVLAEMVGLMESRLSALQEQWDKGVKSPRTLPFLTSKSRAILRQIGQDPDTVDNAAPSVSATPSQQPAAEKPKTVRQNGVIYTLGEDGQYH